MRYREILRESAPMASQPRDHVAQHIERWFAAHGIRSKANLASPLVITKLGHTDSILIDVRDWPDGNIDSLTMLKTLRAEFDDVLEAMGWHFSNNTAPDWTHLGTVMRVKVAPNYPSKTVSVPRILTHSTRQHNVASILAHGLQPRSENSNDKYPARIYLAIPSDGSWALTQSLKGDERDPWVTLTVDTSKIPNAVFYPDPEASIGVWTYQAIPAAAITV